MVVVCVCPWCVGRRCRNELTLKVKATVPVRAMANGARLLCVCVCRAMPGAGVIITVRSTMGRENNKKQEKERGGGSRKKDDS